MAVHQAIKTFCLLFGIVEFIGAALWCVAGAGIYGSPLGSFRGEDVLRVWAFLIAGPFSVLPSAVAMLWKPRLGAAWLIAGGLFSGLLAAIYFFNDRGVLLIPLVSLPMLVVGVWQILWPSGSGTEEPQGRQGFSLSLLSMLFGILLFFVALVGTWALADALASNNVTGLRGPPRVDNPFVRENQDRADGVVLLILVGGAGIITLVRKHLRLRIEFVAGMWSALLLFGLVTLAG